MQQNIEEKLSAKNGTEWSAFEKSRDRQWDWDPIGFVYRDRNPGTWDWNWDGWDWEKYRWDSPRTKIFWTIESQAQIPWTKIVGTVPGFSALGLKSQG